MTFNTGSDGNVWFHDCKGIAVSLSISSFDIDIFSIWQNKTKNKNKTTLSYLCGDHLVENLGVCLKLENWRFIGGMARTTLHKGVLNLKEWKYYFILERYREYSVNVQNKIQGEMWYDNITTQLVFSLFCLLYGKNPFKFYSPNPGCNPRPLFHPHLMFLILKSVEKQTLHDNTTNV